MPRKSSELKILLEAIATEEAEGADSTRLELLARQLVALAMAGDSMALRELLTRIPYDEPEPAVVCPIITEPEPMEDLCHSSQDSTRIAI